MRDAQGNTIEEDHQRHVNMEMEDTAGTPIRGFAKLEVADIPGAILSAGKLIRSGYRAVLDQSGSYIEKGDRRADMKMRRDTFYIPAWMCSVNDDDTTRNHNRTHGDDRDNGDETGGAVGSRDPMPIPVMSDPPGLRAPPTTDVYI